MQQALQGLYELQVAHDVNDFFIRNPQQAADLQHHSKQRSSRETLYLSQTEDNLDLALFLDDQVLDQLAQDNPLNNLHPGNLEAFCLALEGVSHFLYLTWNAGFNRPVTMLEMELQAEVDKFVMLHLCFEDQRQVIEPGRLRRLLFETARLQSDLNSEESRRYRDASNYAEKYCWKLESGFLGNRSRQNLLSEVRQFYRLNQPAKLRRINQQKT